MAKYTNKDPRRARVKSQQEQSNRDRKIYIITSKNSMVLSSKPSFFLFNSMNVLKINYKKIYWFSGQEDAHFETIAGSIFILFNLWFQTMRSQNFHNFFFR